ncbi:hypothetical protein [Salipaludibacillus neizhouensis]|uniref:hypothetical protein n=1 Tax=Salipaludibacillus neizhouensis TaxID=885475 RepID=UPI0016019AFC|nr:hypothetical protein [Salipaludibacillus neizhouensis]
MCICRFDEAGTYLIGSDINLDKGQKIDDSLTDKCKIYQLDINNMAVKAVMEE